jgi:hypothetical protein
VSVAGKIPILSHAFSDTITVEFATTSRCCADSSV